MLCRPACASALKANSWTGAGLSAHTVDQDAILIWKANSTTICSTTKWLYKAQGLIRAR